jgi:hypothetical protein
MPRGRHLLFLAHRDNCPESYCHDPGVGVTPQGKNFNLSYIFWTIRDADISHIDTSWRDLSFYTKTFDLMTCILNFGLVLKNFNWTISFEPYALELWYLRYRCIMKRPFFWYQDFWPCDLDLELWPSFEKNFNLGCIFWTISTRALIL